MNLSRATLILASASPYKRELLSRLKVPFQSQDAAIDESPAPDESPEALASRLAFEKARAVAKEHSGAFVLGADQVIALDRKIFHKPGSVEAAAEQLMELQGKTHKLINAVTLLTPKGTRFDATAIYEMVMRPLTQKQANDYVAEDRPLDCAGSYRIEAAGIRLFEAARGDDPSAIEGLPLTRVWGLLLQAGFFDE